MVFLFKNFIFNTYVYFPYIRQTFLFNRISEVFVQFSKVRSNMKIILEIGKSKHNSETTSPITKSRRAEHMKLFTDFGSQKLSMFIFFFFVCHHLSLRSKFYYLSRD